MTGGSDRNRNHSRVGDSKKAVPIRYGFIKREGRRHRDQERQEAHRWNPLPDTVSSEFSHLLFTRNKGQKARDRQHTRHIKGARTITETTKCVRRSVFKVKADWGGWWAFPASQPPFATITPKIESGDDAGHNDSARTRSRKRRTRFKKGGRAPGFTQKKPYPSSQTIMSASRPKYPASRKQDRHRKKWCRTKGPRAHAGGSLYNPSLTIMLPRQKGKKRR